MPMDCREWQAVISAAHDGEPVATEELSAAAAHCASCPDCAAFRDALARMDTMRAPLAPPGLTERIMRAVDAEAAQAAETAARPHVPPSVAEAPETRPEWLPAWVTRRRLWGATALATAAAVIAGFALVRTREEASPIEGGRYSGPIIASPRLAAPQAEGTASAGAGTADTATATAAAGSYISFSGHAYRPGTILSVDASTLTTIGATTSALDRPAAPGLLTVYRSPTADGSVLVATPAGVQQFQPVVRSYAGKTFQLAAGGQIARFGEWPTLPGRFPRPTQPDGTPTFHPAGTDALGVTVYALAGASADTGFAIAPGTSASDPAGGNPDWTWWDPLVVP